MSSSMPHAGGERMKPSQRNGRLSLRFPLALKKARLAKRLKQETLAAQLHIKLRTLVSWETGTRIPSVGMVAFLGYLLMDRFDSGNELALAYIADDLARQPSLWEDNRFQMLAQRVLEQLTQIEQEHDSDRASHFSLFQEPLALEKDSQGHYQDQERLQREQQREDVADDSLHYLFSVLEILHKHTELIPVVHDFLREMVPE